MLFGRAVPTKWLVRPIDYQVPVARRLSLARTS